MERVLYVVMGLIAVACVVMAIVGAFGIIAELRVKWMRWRGTK